MTAPDAARYATGMAHPEKLPKTREALLELHREARARRNAATRGSVEQVEASDLLGRIEVEIARLERAMDPPLV